MKVAETPSDLITAIWGSYAEAARWAGYEDERGIYNWRQRGIPPSYHVRLAIEAKRRGIKFSPSVFGLDGDDADEFVDMMGWRNGMDACA